MEIPKRHVRCVHSYKILPSSHSKRCGKIRIQIFPPRWTYLVIALLAASICRAVSQTGSTAFSPYEPKEISVPRESFPFVLLRPLCHFLCFTFFGCNMVFKNFALINPDLYSNCSVSSVSRGAGKIDISPQSM